ncbi:hypothetical protein CERSUDRAFT_125022 [Gelatoporia subvermispora B]|uniref:F-box domain-containing protein n=1 Tax=Ceriporiopsis subvermispora (strain B) TaxID=914234 RepID=M2PGC1_CERS8|nr:hypothetical protein CERSUDRAFT_125022 [Gelatoporia subvermispora B]
MPGHSVLPPELTDRVIDFLHDDAAVLKACSLVCRSWLPSCRFHKFSFTFIGSEHQPLFKRTLQALPYIGPYIRHVLVDFRKYEDINCFDYVARNLPNLRMLQINFSVRIFDGVDAKEATFKIATVKSVTQLSFFYDAIFDELDQLAEFLGCFPNVEELRIERIDVEEDVGEFPDPEDMHAQVLANTLARAPLRRLEVERDVYVVACCMSSHPLRTLHTLQTEYYFPGDLYAMPMMLLALRGSPLLEELTIDITSLSHIDLEDETDYYSALKDCPSIPVLRFLATTEIVVPAVTMLSQITAATTIGELQLFITCSLKIFLHGNSYTAELVRGLVDLAVALEQTRDTIFRRVSITVGCTCWGSAHLVCLPVRKTISDAFGSLLERNVTLVFWDHSKPSRGTTSEIFDN